MKKKYVKNSEKTEKKPNDESGFEIENEDWDLGLEWKEIDFDWEISIKWDDPEKWNEF